MGERKDEIERDGIERGHVFIRLVIPMLSVCLPAGLLHAQCSTLLPNLFILLLQADAQKNKMFSFKKSNMIIFDNLR